VKICLLGFDTLPVLAPEYGAYTVGGESVQQTLLARALVARGHDVSIVAYDYGQADGARWDGIRVFKSFAPSAGVPVLRFGHPRWTGVWSALARADAELYYASCAGMHVALASLFCAQHNRSFVFRAASDSDCDPARLLVRYARDRWLYAYGLRRADAILVQSVTQQRSLARHFGLASSVAGMFVEPPPVAVTRDIDVLWVSNIRQLKRPDRVLALADQLPTTRIHMVGGSLPGEEPLYEQVCRDAASRQNIVFHGRLSYRETTALYPRARLLVNTSEVEGFPNSYLQAWISGAPVITSLDPDSIIERNGLGLALRSPADLLAAVRRLLDDAPALASASARCRRFIAQHFSDDVVLAPYLESFEDAAGARFPPAAALSQSCANDA
jgi:glycosyltransferase involved in cell wall biosynthesis